MPRPMVMPSAAYPISSSMSHSARLSLPPETATSTCSPGRSMAWSWIARATWSRQNLTKWSPQKLALWRRRSMTAGPRQTVHFIGARPPPPSTSRDHGPDLDLVVVGEHGVAGHERVAADHQHRLAVEVELAQQLADAQGAGQLELAARVAKQDAHVGSIVACAAENALNVVLSADEGPAPACRRRSRPGDRSRSCARASPRRGRRPPARCRSRGGPCGRSRRRGTPRTTARTRPSPPDSCRAPGSGAGRGRPRSLAQGPWLHPADLDDGAALLAGPAAEQEREQQHDRRGDHPGRDDRDPGRRGLVASAALELAELGLEIVAGDAGGGSSARGHRPTSPSW